MAEEPMMVMMNVSVSTLVVTHFQTAIKATIYV
jgi:hypothetical protein